MSMSPRETFARFREETLAGNLAAIDDLWADEAVLETPFAPPGTPTRLRGREDIVAYTRAGRESLPVQFDEFRKVVFHETHDPEVIIVEYEMAATLTATGRTAAAPFVLVLRVRDGRIVLWREYQNMLAMAEALGQLPALLASLGSPST